MEFRGDAAAGVDHGNAGSRGAGLQRDADDAGVGGEFKGVADEVLEDAEDEVAVGGDNEGRVGRSEFETAGLAQGFKGGESFAGKGGEIAFGAMQIKLAGFHFADVEEGIHHFEQLAGAAAGAGQETGAFTGEGVFVVFGAEIEVADEGGEGRAQVVDDHVGEVVAQFLEAAQGVVAFLEVVVALLEFKLKAAQLEGAFRRGRRLPRIGRAWSCSRRRRRRRRGLCRGSR